MDVFCAGMVVADMFNDPVDRLPSPGELIQVSKISAFVGGCAGNVAINLAKQELRTAVAGKVGNDPQGRFIRDALEAARVEADFLTTTDAFSTSQTMIVLVKGEDRRFLHCFGANRDFRVSDIDHRAATKAKVFYLGGYVSMPGLLAGEVADLLAELRKHGVKTVLDVVIPAGTSDLSELIDVLPHVDVFTPNNDEAAVITGSQDPIKQAKALTSFGVRTVVITCGADGAVVGSDGRLTRFDAYPTELVDPSGGGDAFTAGYITGMVRDLPSEKTMAYASALGASCVADIGCHAGTFTRRKAKEFIKMNKLKSERIG